MTYLVYKAGYGARKAYSPSKWLIEALFWGLVLATDIVVVIVVKYFVGA